MDTQRLKDKILQLAIQGKLVEQDKNDEPASALLQRIKEERDKLVREGKIRKPKKLAPIEEEEKPFDIPKGWEWVRLGEVIEIIGGVSYKKGDVLVDNFGMRVLRGGNIQNNSLILYDDDVYINKDSIAKEKIIREGDIIIVASTGSKTVIGKPAFIEKDYENIAIGAFLRIIRPINILNSKYISKIFFSGIYRNYIRNISKGTNINNVKNEYLNNFIIPLPPLAEQKRIVEKVDQLFTLIDELDSNKEDLLEVINLTRNQVLQEAIQGKLVEQNPEDEPASVLLDRIKEERDKLVKEKKIRKPKKLPPIEEEEKPFAIPEGWEWVRLGEALNIRRGASPRPIKKYLTDDENGINWIKIGDATDNSKYITSVNEKITPDGAKKSVYLKSGTLVMSNSMSFGKAYILDVDGCIHDGWLAFEFNKDYLETELLQFFLNASYDRFDKLAVGTGVRNLNIDRVRATVIPLPPLAEQKRIVKKVDAIMDMLDELESQLTN